MNKKLLTIPALMLIATIGYAAPASADTDAHLGVGVNTTVGAHVQLRANDDNDGQGYGMGMMRGDMMRNWAVFGTVTAVNGSSVTVQTKAMTKGNTTIPATTYTVTTSSSTTVDKNNVTSAVSAIAVGDTVMVEGTVSGTTVTATKIHDGVMMKGENGAALPAGNGQPVIGGTVTAVSGNTITITNQSNATYTIDVTNAKITKGNTTSTASNIAVGDNLIAQGTINGNTVTAVNVVDSTNVTTGNNGEHRGFFGSIGSFFARLFGFGK